MRFKTHLLIHLDRLADNYQSLQKLAPANQVLFMIKADAYGHGLVPVVRFAAQNLGIKEFGCASVGEAIYLREQLRDAQFDLYVFSDLELDLPQCAQAYTDKRILPVISDLADLDFILSEKTFRHLPLCLKFNTGMNRLGFPLNQVEQVIQKIKKSGRKNLHHVFSHFSSSGVPVEKGTTAHKQYELFQTIKGELQKSGLILERTSMANSGAIEQKFALKETHIRPGLMLYGPPSFLGKETNWKGKTISDLVTHIIRVFEIKKGEPIGYNDIPCPADGVVAIVPLGYGDGINTHYSGLKLNFEGETGTLIGRVNMDMSAFLFPHSAAHKIKPNRSFQIWGEDPSQILDISKQVGTIPYELFCQVSSRVPRIYSLK